MPLDMSPEEKMAGQANFDRVADGLTRRQFMKSLTVAGGVVVPVSAAAYFGYQTEKGSIKPVRTALIGAGDEGGVLMGEHDPKFVEIVTVCDIRPSNQKRIFEDERVKNANSPRKGLKYHYGSNADKTIKIETDYKKILADKSIEAVIIALPLHLHAPVAIECMKAGKHVLCEKLMAWNITQCKDMIKAADQNDVILSIGHQRHYSLLYAHVLEMLQADLLGDIRHIRALWHRNNAKPKYDAQGNVVPGKFGDSWNKDAPKEDRDALEKNIRAMGYKSMEELINWRLYKRTGGGLMAELGSHQLDACSIFLGKVRPLAVTGVGGKYFYKDNREVEDHVFCTFEFPGKNYYKDEARTQIGDKNDVVVVTYSSISTNAFEKYGECIMGSKGTLVVEQEQNVQLYPDGERKTEVKVGGGDKKPALESSSSTGGAERAVTAGAGGPVSRGYREEMNHFAYCIRMWKEGDKKDRPLPRCHGRVAMADAIIALTANLSMERQQRIAFDSKWFDAATTDVPDPEKKAETVA